MANEPNVEVQLLLPTDLMEDLEDIAKEEGISLDDLILRLVNSARQTRPPGRDEANTIFPD